RREPLAQGFLLILFRIFRPQSSLGFLLQKKRGIGITLLAFDRSFWYRVFKPLPGFSRPSARAIKLKIFSPRFNRQVPGLGLFISDGQVKQRAGLIVFAQAWFAQDFAQQVQRALK